MARQEHRKEDLIADATAMVNRAEFHCAELGEPLVAGFRANGALSLFFGEDPVFHFNDASELRRAYVDGALFKAADGNLISMVRNRTKDEHQLRSRQLSADEQSDFLERLNTRLCSLQTALQAGELQMGRSVSEAGVELSSLLDAWLTQQTSRSNSIPIANSPGLSR